MIQYFSVSLYNHMCKNRSVINLKYGHQPTNSTIGWNMFLVRININIKINIFIKSINVLILTYSWDDILILRISEYYKDSFFGGKAMYESKI